MIAPILGESFVKSAEINNRLNQDTLHSASTNFSADMANSASANIKEMINQPKEFMNFNDTLFNNLLGNQIKDPVTNAYTGARDNFGIVGRLRQEEADANFMNRKQDLLNQQKQGAEAAFNNFRDNEGFMLLGENGSKQQDNDNNDYTKIAIETIQGKWGNDKDRVQKWKNAGINPNKAQEAVDYVYANKAQNDVKQIRNLLQTRTSTISQINDNKVQNLIGNNNYSYNDVKELLDSQLIAASQMDIRQFANAIRVAGGDITKTPAYERLPQHLKTDPKKLEREILALDQIRIDQENANNGVLTDEYARGILNNTAMSLQQQGYSAQQAAFNAILAAGMSPGEMNKGMRGLEDAQTKYLNDAAVQRLQAEKEYYEVKDKNGNVIGANFYGGGNGGSSTKTTKTIVGGGSGNGGGGNPPKNSITDNDSGKYLYFGDNGVYDENAFDEQGNMINAQAELLQDNLNSKSIIELEQLEKTKAQLEESMQSYINKGGKETDFSYETMKNTLEQVNNKINQTQTTTAQRTKLNKEQLGRVAVEVEEKTNKEYIINPNTGKKIYLEELGLSASEGYGNFKGGVLRELTESQKADNEIIERQQQIKRKSKNIEKEQEMKEDNTGVMLNAGEGIPINTKAKFSDTNGNVLKITNDDMTTESYGIDRYPYKVSKEITDNKGNKQIKEYKVNIKKTDNGYVMEYEDSRKKEEKLNVIYEQDMLNGKKYSTDLYNMKQKQINSSVKTVNNYNENTSNPSYQQFKEVVRTFDSNNLGKMSDKELRKLYSDKETMANIMKGFKSALDDGNIHNTKSKLYELGNKKESEYLNDGKTKTPSQKSALLTISLLNKNFDGVGSYTTEFDRFIGKINGLNLKLDSKGKAVNKDDVKTLKEAVNDLFAKDEDNIKLFQKGDTSNVVNQNELKELMIELIQGAYNEQNIITAGMRIKNKNAHKSLFTSFNLY